MELSFFPPYLESIAGQANLLFRPPYGSYNDHVQEVARELGFTLVNWSIDPKDWDHRNPDTVYSTIMNEAHDGAIIVLHDIHESTADAMERVIPVLLANGYQLVTVSELLYHRNVPITPGAVIKHGN